MTLEDPLDRDRVRLEVLKSFKERFQRRKNVSPFHDHQVIQYHTNITPLHVTQIHADVRQRVLDAITEVREQRTSKVVILAGDPGLGKTHLLHNLRDPKLSDEHQFVLVFDSNHWVVDELESQMLNWMVVAIAGSPDGRPDVLADKMSFLAFRLLDKLLSTPGEVQRMMLGSAWWQRVRALLWPKRYSLPQLHEQRDVQALSLLDFDKLVDRFCVTFLRDSQHPFHRKVVSHLLHYLMTPSRRPAIRDWLVAPGKGEHAEGIASLRKQVEVIQILCSLFSPEVAEAFDADASDPRNRSRVFVFAFDQLEARQAFMRSEDDWMQFFRKLSELYNTLPNVFVLFTMPLKLRKELLSRMEAQFRDRIRHDDNFLLQPPTDDDVRALFHHRMRTWLGSEADAVADRLVQADAQLLPFASDQELIAAAGEPRTTVRDVLRGLDAAFSERLRNTLVGSRLDYLVARQELEPEEGLPSVHTYVATHTEPLLEVLRAFGPYLPKLWRMSLEATRPVLQGTLAARKIGVLELVFRSEEPGSNSAARVFVVVLPSTYTQLEGDVLHLVKGKWKDRNLLWVLRPNRIDWDREEDEQVTYVKDDLPADHTTMRALAAMLRDAAAYRSTEAGEEELAQTLEDALAETWLHTLWQTVRSRLDHQAARPAAEEVVGGE